MDGSGGPSNPQEEEKVSVGEDLLVPPSPAPMNKDAVMVMVEVSIML